MHPVAAPASAHLSLADVRSIVLPITQSYGVRNVRIFGSFAREEQTTASDVDLLIDIPATMSMFDFSGLKLSLEAALHRKVDLVPEENIKAALRAPVLADARPL